jgi:hypothetical protein
MADNEHSREKHLESVGWRNQLQFKDFVTAQEMVDALHNYAAEQLAIGVETAKIEKMLTEQGLTAKDAETLVNTLKQARMQAAIQEGRRNMFFGALWCLGGIAVTSLTLQAAKNAGGGTYVIASGAILFGGIQVLGAGRLHHKLLA